MQWPRPRRFRPFGYNLVELSRFVVGAFPLVIQSPTRLAVEGSSPTLSPFGNAFTLILPSQRSFNNHSRHLDFDEFRWFFRLETGIPRSAAHDGRLGDPRVTASFTPGYELSKPTFNPAPL
jgi:hypothetical protein